MRIVWLTKNLVQATNNLNSRFQLKATSYELLKKWKSKGTFKKSLNCREKVTKRRLPKILCQTLKAWSTSKKVKRLDASTNKCSNLLIHRASHCRTMWTRNWPKTAVKSVKRSKLVCVQSTTLSSANNSANFSVTRVIHKFGQSHQLVV